MNYGGKANALLILKENGFNVPAFFILPYDFFNNTIVDNDSEFSLEQKEYIFKEFKKLNCDLVAVRSSALGEDSKDKSFAGQYTTYLYVTLEELLSKIKQCFLASNSSKVKAYDDNIHKMNIIVQKMIDPDYSGVAFSKDISVLDSNYSVIEVLDEVGENLVSGVKTPTKYLVRRQTKKIDLKNGKLNIDYLIDELMDNILKIEKIFKVVVDIEFCIKDNVIYFLQARPVTALSIVKKDFELTISREKSIIEQEIYYQGEYEGIKRITRGLYYFKPLFIYNKKTNLTDIYYNNYDLEEEPSSMYYYMDLDYDKIIKEYELVKKYINELNDTIDNNKDLEVNSFVDKLIFIYPYSSLGQLAGHFPNVSDRVKELLFEFRNNYDYILYKAEEYLLKYIYSKLDDKYKEYIKFISLKELNKLPSIKILEKRKQGYIYNGKINVYTDYEKWLNKNNININKIDSSDLNGDVAYFKDAIGRACLVFSEKDFVKVKKGDIIISPMTTPKFTVLFDKINGIITDEGGITCHAAIVSRELKIPCIVGTKNATKVIKDGDMIKIKEGKIICH